MNTLTIYRTLITLGMVVCSSCGGSDNNNGEDGSSADISTAPISTAPISTAPENVLTFTIVAERAFNLDITPEFEVKWNYSRISSYPDNIDASLSNGILSVKSKNKFLGEDSLTVRLKNAETDEQVYRNIIFTIVEPQLTGNEDYSISYWCDDSSGLYNLSGSQANTIDMEFTYDNLTPYEYLYEAHTPAYTASYIPMYSRVEVEQHVKGDAKSKSHHQQFFDNLPGNLLLTCNYPNGEAELFIPIKSNPDWRAVIPGLHSNYQYDRNDIVFYISPLSDLRTNIYRSEYNATGDQTASIIASDAFMESVFPGAQYNPVSSTQYGVHPQKESRKNNMFPILEDDNQKYYRKFEYWRNIYSNGDTDTLIDYIANIYDAYVHGTSKDCLNFSLCAEFFEDFTQTLTANFDFKNGISSWEVIENYSDSATGRVIQYPATNELEISINVNTDQNEAKDYSIVDVYQTQHLENTSPNDYFFEFKLTHVFGGSTGFGPIAGTYSSGWGGAYLCFKNQSGTQLGCATWIDHTDKIDLGESGVYGDTFNVSSSDFFYVHKLYSVMRRQAPEQEEIEFTVSVKDILDFHLPALGFIEDQIASIDYGIFVTEARNTRGECYHCDAKVIAKELKLSQRVQH